MLPTGQLWAASACIPGLVPPEGSTLISVRKFLGLSSSQPLIKITGLTLFA